MNRIRNAFKNNILIVLTSHTRLGGADDLKHPGDLQNAGLTGFFFEEMAVPYYAFMRAGYNVDLVSIRGGAAPADPHSLKEPGANAVAVDRFLNDAVAMEKLSTTPSIDQVDVDLYTGVFIPGGHGAMWDMPGHNVLGSVLSTLWARGAVVGAVCHGVAGLIGVVDERGMPIVQGRRISAFTDSEERAIGLDVAVPFLLESRLRQLGARFEYGDDFHAFATRDGRLVSGQNPASSGMAAADMIAALSEESTRQIA